MKSDRVQLGIMALLVLASPRIAHVIVQLRRPAAYATPNRVAARGEPRPEVGQVSTSERG